MSRTKRAMILALERVRHFRVELHGVEAALLVGHRGDRGRFVAADDLEARRQFGDLVAVAHPDVEQAVALGVAAVLDAVEQRGVAAGAHLGIAEFAPFFELSTLPPSCCGHRLHAVADAEHRHAQFEDHLRRARSPRARRPNSDRRRG
jgi:hypothetical protein